MQSKEELREILNKNEVISFTPTGESMWPFLKNGKNTVLIKKYSTKECLSVYDVILYVGLDGKIKLHRIIEIFEDSLSVCGDSLHDVERNIKKEQILGIVISYYKGKKNILRGDKKVYKKVKFWYKHKLIRRIFIKLHYCFKGK